MNIRPVAIRIAVEADTAGRIVSRRLTATGQGGGTISLALPIASEPKVLRYVEQWPLGRQPTSAVL